MLNYHALFIIMLNFELEKSGNGKARAEEWPLRESRSAAPLEEANLLTFQNKTHKWSIWSQHIQVIGFNLKRINGSSLSRW